ncbi:tRNA (guanosine(37)-N1)-methyltransferase TrmD [Candidatus Parcubacteria bacterium]|nr:MAG: tRNA (guanosine(37)-N1)-methyltransferase TrmD [Candidatus Parcubacteria bacterium]
MKFRIITTIPETFDSYLGASILRRAQERKLIDVGFVNPRDFASDDRRTVDDKPYGGGAGMVLMAEPLLKAVERAKKGFGRERPRVVLLSAKGKPFNQRVAYQWAKSRRPLVLISGRYEGIDERVRQILKAEEISVGPYVLTDGDAAAMVIISAVSRLIPGVIRLESLAEESHWNLLLKREAEATGKGLEYPHYTRPAVVRWKGKKYAVPPVLLSGDHRAIQKWREKHGR